MADRRVGRGIVAGLESRWREADDPRAPLIVMLHGLTGDEDVMWIFEPAFPASARLLALRAPFARPGGGFSWIDPEHGPMPDIPAFADASQAIADAAAETLRGEPNRSLVLVGFSQGAALALSAAALGILHPHAVVALAGILPPGDLTGLPSVPIFWAHGKKDVVVPVERARRDIERLRQAGASLTYCEADVGHKLGAECFQGLRQWFAGLSTDHPPSVA